MDPFGEKPLSFARAIKAGILHWFTGCLSDYSEPGRPDGGRKPRKRFEWNLGRVAHTMKKMRIAPHRAAGTRFSVSEQSRRLTGPSARLYCAPSHLKRVFRDFPAIDGVQKRAILGSSPETFVVPGYSLKIRIGNLCRDSRRCAFGALR